MGVKIAGLGKCLPEKIVTNNEMAQLVDTSHEWIIERTGIERRHIATTESGVDMACAAAEEALGDLDRRTIGLVLVATVTPDAIVPVNSCQIKRRLNLENAIAFDMNAACSGFMYGLWNAEALMKNGANPESNTVEIQRALVVGVERLSRITNWEERSSCILFGDGAGAAVLENDSREPGILATFIKNYDDKKGALSCGKEYHGTPFWEDEPSPQLVTLHGRAIFKFAAGAIEEVTAAALGKAGLTLEEIDWFVPHQANGRIIEAVSRRLGQPIEKFQISIRETGNVSAASIPMAFYDLVQSGKLKKGQKIAIIGFGGGLSAAAAIVQW